MRKIIHIDMDSFFPSVEILEAPHLKHKPVAVGGRPDNRGVIASCNYIARRYGVRSAMSSYKAIELCSDLIIIMPNMSKYSSYSREIGRIFAKYTDKIEFVSLDEAYLDVTDVELHNNIATMIARSIKQDILNTTGLNASAGVSHNKFLAKIASDWNKPNGLMVISPYNTDKFMLNLAVSKIPGVGRTTQIKLSNIGIKSCKDLQRFSKYELVKHFKNYGLKLYDLARGVDDREVVSERIRKSLSVENTFPSDLCSPEECMYQITLLFDKLVQRLQKHHELHILKLFIKLKDSSFRNTTHESVDHKTPSIERFNLLFKECYAKLSHPIRLIGIGVRFHESTQDPQMHLKI